MTKLLLTIKGKSEDKFVELVDEISFNEDVKEYTIFPKDCGKSDFEVLQIDLRVTE